MMLLLVYGALQRRLPWLLIGLLVSGYIVAHPVKAQFRTAVEFTGQSLSPIARLGLMLDVTRNTLSFQGNTLLGVHGVEVALDRLNGITLFATVLEATPDIIPFWHGYTYRPLLWKLVPKAIFPNKPDETIGQDFPHRYELIANDDLSTVVDLPQLIEGYVNFGLVGLSIEMLVLGAVYRLTEGMFVHPAMGAGALIGAAYVLGGYCLIEGNASAVIAAFPTELLLLAFLNILMKGCRIFYDHTR